VATNFPGSVDSFPRPTSTTNTNDPGFELDVVIDNLSDALEAVETRVLARRGGIYASAANALSAGSVTYVTLTTTTGDTDLVSGGNLVIPAGAGGVWSVSATWEMGQAMSAVAAQRAFIDADFSSPALIVRTGPPNTAEDRCTATGVVAVAAGATIKFGVYVNTGSGFQSKVTVSAYRIGA